MQFTQDELAKLRMFRELARDLHPSVIRYNEFKFRIRIPNGSGSFIPEGAFHQRISFVRQAYLQKEDTNVFRILHILGDGRPELHERLGQVRDQWNGSFQDSMIFQTKGHTYQTEKIFQYNLNAKYAHRKAEAGVHLRNLESLGNFPRMPLQILVLNLSRCILVLDCLIADVLGEDRLPNLDLGDMDGISSN